jgi:hypothetical protein
MRFFSSRIAAVLALFLLGVLVPLPLAFAYVSSSTNYRIQLDSINMGGGLSTSTSYRVEDTLGESGVGTSSSATYQIKAGYQQMREVYIAITAPADITLTPSILSVGGGTGNGSAVWTVTTDNEAGYTMNIRASTSPALVSGANTFANYVPAAADPDFTFTTPAAASRFGFTPEGTDIVQKFKDNGTTCNTGALDTASACWFPLLTTTETVVTRTSSNHPSGTQTTVRFRAVSGASNVQPIGSYGATSTLTVLAL